MLLQWRWQSRFFIGFSGQRRILCGTSHFATTRRGRSNSTIFRWSTTTSHPPWSCPRHAPIEWTRRIDLRRIGFFFSTNKSDASPIIQCHSAVLALYLYTKKCLLPRTHCGRAGRSTGQCRRSIWQRSGTPRWSHHSAHPTSTPTAHGFCDAMSPGSHGYARTKSLQSIPSSSPTQPQRWIGFDSRRIFLGRLEWSSRRYCRFLFCTIGRSVPLFFHDSSIVEGIGRCSSSQSCCFWR